MHMHRTGEGSTSPTGRVHPESQAVSPVVGTVNPLSSKQSWTHRPNWLPPESARVGSAASAATSDTGSGKSTPAVKNPPTPDRELVDIPAQTVQGTPTLSPKASGSRHRSRKIAVLEEDGEPPPPLSPRSPVARSSPGPGGRDWRLQDVHETISRVLDDEEGDEVDVSQVKVTEYEGP